MCMVFLASDLGIKGWKCKGNSKSDNQHPNLSKAQLNSITSTTDNNDDSHTAITITLLCDCFDHIAPHYHKRPELQFTAGATWYKAQNYNMQQQGQLL